MGGCCTRHVEQPENVKRRDIDSQLLSDTSPLIDRDNNTNNNDASSYDTRSDVIIDTAALPPNTAGKSASKKKKTTDMDDLHYVDYAELGNFILKKMNTKTLNRLWRHLDEDAQGHIEKEEVLNILQFTAVFGQPAINKKKIKMQFSPVRDWILSDKMVNKRVVLKEEFRPLFGAWLKEYGQRH